MRGWEKYQRPCEVSDLYLIGILLSGIKNLMKRSVRIANHSTSISLEAEFWEALKHMAREDGVSLNLLVGQIDAERMGNLSSALRVYVLKRLQRGRE